MIPLTMSKIGFSELLTIDEVINLLITLISMNEMLINEFKLCKAGIIEWLVKRFMFSHVHVTLKNKNSSLL